MKKKITAQEITFVFAGTQKWEEMYEPLPEGTPFTVSILMPTIDEIRIHQETTGISENPICSKIDGSLAKKMAIFKAIREKGMLVSSIFRVELKTQVEAVGMSQYEITPLQLQPFAAIREVKQALNSLRHFSSESSGPMGWSKYAGPIRPN